MVFTNTDVNKVNIEFNGQMLKQVDHAKVSGVFIDEKLLWKLQKAHNANYYNSVS